MRVSLYDTEAILLSYTNLPNTVCKRSVPVPAGCHHTSRRYNTNPIRIARCICQHAPPPGHSCNTLYIAELLYFFLVFIFEVAFKGSAVYEALFNHPRLQRNERGKPPSLRGAFDLERVELYFASKKNNRGRKSRRREGR